MSDEVDPTASIAAAARRTDWKQLEMQTATAANDVQRDCSAIDPIAVLPGVR